jgi:hypothetical protein
MAYYFPEACALEVKVLYKADKVYEAGYEKCKWYNPWAQFIPETDFRKQVLQFTDVHKRTTMFAVDDIIWKNKFSMKDREYVYFTRASDKLCLSLRLWPGISWSYMMNCEARKPQFISRNTWRRNAGTADWCYPMSCDCNIYRTQDILQVLKRIDFSSPNTLEGEMANKPLNKPYMMCFDESKVLNVPANRVQNEAKNNRSMAGDYLELNKEFMAGGRLKFEHLIGFKNNAVHFPMELLWR